MTFFVRVFLRSACLEKGIMKLHMIFSSEVHSKEAETAGIIQLKMAVTVYFGSDFPHEMIRR